MPKKSKAGSSGSGSKSAKSKSKPSKKSQGDGKTTDNPIIRRVPIAKINVAEDEFRELDQKTVSDLVESIEQVGLMHLPTVYTRKATDDDGEEEYDLVAGRHRLAAAKKLGWKEIDVIVVKRIERKNQMRRITENLHRKSLSKQDEGKEIKAWLRLRYIEEGGQGAQPNDKGISAAAKKFGKSRRTVKRLLDIVPITDDAAEALKEAKLAKNGRVLAEIARLAPDKQVARVERIVRERAREADRRKAKADAKNKGKNKGKAKASKAGLSGGKGKPPVTDDTDDTPYGRLVAAWNDATGFQEAWAKADEQDREDFYEKVMQDIEVEGSDDDDVDD